MNKIVKSRFVKFVACFLIVNLLTELFFPTIAYALTSGPSQPEVQSFEPVGTSEMVNVFTGDFTYNIPLLEIPGPDGGYPLNMAYHSGIGMDQEASWVGLGWNLNPGALNRTMRGLPDEFDGDEVDVKQDMKPSHTFGVAGSPNPEFLGITITKGLNANIAGLGMYYNNYTGFGYNLNFGIQMGFALGSAEASHLTGGIGLSLDSQSGATISPSLTLDVPYSRRTGEGETYKSTQGDVSYRLGMSINSNTGLTNISLSGGADVGHYTYESASRLKGGNTIAGISFSHTAFTPSIGMERSGVRFDFSVKAGSELAGFFANGEVSGFYNFEQVANQESKVAAYGYLHLEKNDKEGEQKGIMDYNTEKQVPLLKTTPYLPSPHMTHDIYSITGQGIAGVFRAYRNDIGILHNREKNSRITGLGGGIDFGAGNGTKIGWNGQFTHTQVKSGKWSNDNDEYDINFRGVSNTNRNYEPYYFKSLGETTTDETNEMEHIGGKYPIAFSTAATDVTQYKLENNSNVKNKEENFRQSRNQVIQQFKNKDIYGSTKKEILGEYQISYYDDKNSLVSYNRSDRKKHHPAGFTVTNTNGSRYVYALPAINKEQSSTQYSVPSNRASDDQTNDLYKTKVDIPEGLQYEQNANNKKYNHGNKLFNKETLPEYAHSFLLTSILGTDYIDADGTPGPSDGDFGYWVKFTYQKTSDNYHWKAPFFGANFLAGLNSSINDNLGSYMDGKKEIWYLKQIETKTHIAIFNLSKREDGRDIQDINQTGNANGYDASKLLSSSKALYKIDNIKLYDKKEYQSNSQTAVPLKTVHYEYTYDLCGHVYNNTNKTTNDINPITGKDINDNKGKLTLKKVWFTYRNSTIGSTTPYVFDYNERKKVGDKYEIDLDNNPDYNPDLYDSWGNYKPNATINNPYVQQFDVNNPDFKKNLDQRLSVWNLKSIKLPSGSVLQIDYESNEYAYVQDKPVMQMMKIVDIKESDVHATTKGIITHDEKSRIYFELEQPTSDTKELDKYFNPSPSTLTPTSNPLKKNTKNLYFKILSYVRYQTEKQYREFLPVYASYTEYGFDTQSMVNGKYTRAWIKLDTKSHKGEMYHPFKMAAWNFIQAQASDLVNIGQNLDVDQSDDLEGGQFKARSLLNGFRALKTMVQGYYDHANKQAWGTKLDLNDSYVRLACPDQKKYGGGIRVKQIILHEDGDINNPSNPEKEYGQVYSYLTKEGTTSGVATFEPKIGGDENPFKTVESFNQNILFKTDIELQYEGPINEGYYPAPSVGYSRVTVESLASFRARNNTIPNNIHKSGITINDFYTCKDYPVETDVTTINSKHRNIPIPLPTIGMIKINNLTATQGFSITLNDMHGKPKKVTNAYHINNVLQEDAYVEYIYKTKQVAVQGTKRITEKELDNDVLTITKLINDNGTGAQTATKKLGQDYEFFTEMNQTTTRVFQAGVDVNLDVLVFPFPPFVLPITMPWPGASYSSSQVRTATTNKIITMSGLLQKTIVYNGKNKITTENLAYDDLTGQVLLTSVTNDFDAPIYNYNIPAHLVYDQMGAAYKNLGLEFLAYVAQSNLTFAKDGKQDGFKLIATTEDWHTKKLLVEGDEFIFNFDKEKIILTAINGNEYHFTKTSSNDIKFVDDYKLGNFRNFLLCRSGRRNHLDAMVGNITTLADPADASKTNLLDKATPITKYTKEECTNDTNLPAYYKWYCASVNDFPIQEFVNYLKNHLENGELIFRKNQSEYINYPVLYNYFSQNPLFTGPSAKPYARWNGTDYYDFFEVNTNLNILCSDVYGFRCRDINKLKLINNISYSTSTATSYPSGEIYTTYILIFYYTDGTKGAYNCNYTTLKKKLVKEYYNSSGFLDEFKPTIISNTYKLNNVLNISAVSYSDNWGWTELQLQQRLSKKSYVNGGKGIWKQDATYAYLDTRKTTFDNTTSPRTKEATLSKDGTMDNVALFDWNNALFKQCTPKWKKVNEVTKYNENSFELENKDALGRKSSAIYGHDNRLVTAVVANAAYNEIAFESFEEYNAGAITKLEGNSKLIFHQNTASIWLPESYQIISAEKNILILNTPYIDYEFQAGQKIQINGAKILNYTNKSVYGEFTVKNHLETENGGTIIETKESISFDDVWTGTLHINREENNWFYNPKNSVITVSNEIAHTGKNSLLLKNSSNFDYVYIKQNKLLLERGKKYIVDTWVRVAPSVNNLKGILPISSYSSDEFYDNPYKNTDNYKQKLVPPTIEIALNDFGSFYPIPNTEFKPSGQIINGWQHIQGVFEMPIIDPSTYYAPTNENASKHIILKLREAHEYDAIQAGGHGSLPTYFDDIRIYPADSEMKSYVYNKDNYRLEATLDNNNYATFFYYDEQGRLYLQKQETSRGIQTIQEAISHTKGH